MGMENLDVCTLQLFSVDRITARRTRPRSSSRTTTITNGSGHTDGVHDMRSCVQDIRPSTNKLAKAWPFTSFHQEKVCTDYRVPCMVMIVIMMVIGVWVEDDTFQARV